MLPARNDLPRVIVAPPPQDTLGLVLAKPATVANTQAPAAAPEPAPAPDPAKVTAPKESAQKAYWTSGGLLAVSLTGTSLLVGALNSVTPEWTQRALSPMIQSVVNTFNAITGQQFVDRTGNRLRRTLGYGVGAPQHVGVGATMPPKLEDDFMRTFRRKAGINNRVLGARNSFLTFSRLLQWHVSSVRTKLSRGETSSAARLLAGVMVHDRALWFEIRPTEPQMLFSLRLLLSPYFNNLSADVRRDFAAKVKSEVVRIDPHAKDNFDAAYAPLLDGLLSPLLQSAKTAAVTAPAPATKKPPLDDGMRALLSRIKEADAISLPDIQLVADAQANNPAARLSLAKALPSARFRKRVLAIVAARCEELKTSSGHEPTLEEQWSLMQGAFRQAIQERNEARAAGTSAALYAAAGVGSSLAIAGIATQATAATMLALNPVLFTMVGLLMSAAGSTFQDWLTSNSSELNYQLGSEGVLMSEPLQREVLSMFFRNATEDGRPAGQRNAFVVFGQTISSAAVSAEDFIVRGDLASAAGIIASQLMFNRDLWCEMEASPNLLRLLMWELTPHFDRCSMADRNRLKELIATKLSEAGVTGEPLTTYYAPFIDGMLFSNIPPEIENAPAAFDLRRGNGSRGIVGRLVGRVFGSVRSR